MINISEYKKTYNVAECAGIDSWDMDDATSRLEVYNKIAQWVNNDPELKELFTAKVYTVSESASTYRLELLTSTGICACYGRLSTGNMEFSYRYYYNGGNNTMNLGVISTATPDDLRLMLIKGKNSFAFGFYSPNSTINTQIRGVQTLCTDDVGNEEYLGLIIWNNTTLYALRDIYSSSTDTHILAAPSTSSLTALSSFMPMNMNLLSEHCRIMNGHIFPGLTFFEAGGSKWCTLVPLSTSKGLAMELA